MNSLGLKIVLVLVLVSFVSCENQGLKTILRIYDECSQKESFTPCLKKKGITFLDRLARLEKLSVLDGVTVVKSSNETTPVVTEEQLEKSLPRSLEAKDAVLNEILMIKALNYISTRKFQITLPQFDTQELGRSINEGRGKMKKMMGMLMMSVVGKMAGYIPLIFAGLFLLAGKALMVSKIALLLSGILALKKLVESKHGGHGGGHSSGYQSHGGFDKRSYEEAQKMAYKAHAPK